MYLEQEKILVFLWVEILKNFIFRGLKLLKLWIEVF
jgi:hypothetical protein